MKATMIIDDHAGWKLTLEPENNVEETMMAAVHRGMNVKCAVYQEAGEPATLHIIGEAKQWVADALLAPLTEREGVEDE